MSATFLKLCVVFACALALSACDADNRKDGWYCAKPTSWCRPVMLCTDTYNPCRSWETIQKCDPLCDEWRRVDAGASDAVAR